MPQQAQILRLVVASPADVQAERNAVYAVVDQVNRGVAGERGLVLKVSDWKKDAFPGFHANGPQALIDAILHIPECDIFVGIVWKRFGTPVQDARSGTEHEYNLAFEAWRQIGRPQIFFYFNQRSYSPNTKEETDQWGMVLEFRKNFPKEGLWWPYVGKESFKGLVRDHLENFLRDKYPIATQVPPSVGSPATSKALNALHQLPPPPADFTGREDEIRELKAATEEEGVPISGLHGMGGIGKTALALKLAEQLAPQYPDAQIFLDLRGVSEKPLSAAEAHTYVIRAFHPEAKLPVGEAELGALYRSTLHGKRVLLVMDNAFDTAQVAPLLPPVGSAFIVTSRFHLEVAGLRMKDLWTLPLADARSLLLAIAPRIGGNAEPLAKLCGNLPLALRSVASTLVKRIDVSPEDYAQRLAAGRERLEPVEASLRLSYNLLGAPLQKFFRALSVFPETFDAVAATAVWELDPDTAQMALGDLLTYSLLEWNAGLGRYRLHDLVRRFAQNEIQPQERERAARRHSQHYLNVLYESNRLYLKGSQGIKLGLTLFDQELGNIRVGQAWAAQHALDENEAAQACSHYAGAGSLFDLRQNPRERIEWLEPALAAACRLKDRRAEGVHLGNLGLAYAVLGETRLAIEYHEKALVIAREIGDRHDEGNALGNIGNAYADLGETRRAIECYEQQLTITREVGDRRGEGNALGDLGSAYLAIGDPNCALAYQEQQLTITRETGDRRGEGIALGNLGIAYKHLGEPRPAIECYEKALAIHREIGDRQGEGNVLGSLGEAYGILGETRRAIEHYEQHLVIAHEVGDRRGEGTALGNLGASYKDLGEPHRAVDYHEKWLAVTREIGDRRAEAQALTNLGIECVTLGQTRRAIEYHEKALAVFREIGDRQHQGYAANNLGLAYNVLGEPRRAIEYFEQRLVIAREIGDRQGEGKALCNMSLALDKLGERSQAIAHAEAALKIYEEIEDPLAELVRKALEEWGNK